MDTPLTPPPRHLTLPIIQHLITAYKAWHEFLPHTTRDVRYTLGAKIDDSLLETIELIFTASYLGKQQKLPYLQRATSKLDLAKFFLHIMWDMKALDNKRYLALSEQLNDIGKMLGGWRKGLEAKTPVG
jgi:hypothetical protein